jgi:hypothetical protein
LNWSAKSLMGCSTLPMIWACPETSTCWAITAWNWNWKDGEIAEMDGDADESGGEMSIENWIHNYISLTSAQNVFRCCQTGKNCPQSINNNGVGGNSNSNRESNSNRDSK